MLPPGPISRYQYEATEHRVVQRHTTGLCELGGAGAAHPKGVPTLETRSLVQSVTFKGPSVND